MGALLATVALVSACDDQPKPPEVPDSTIVIGAFDFTEGLVMSSLYAEVLKANGFEVRVEEVATREIMEPALEQGHIDLVPEYQGTLLLFLQPFADLRTTDQRNALVQELNVRDLVALDASPGQNQNEIVVTSETASEYDLTKISDLEPVAGELIFGGPPECPARPLCLAGLEDDYGLEFEEFIPLDAGGPLTLAALNGGEIDVGLLFGTDPAIDQRRAHRPRGRSEPPAERGPLAHLEVPRSRIRGRCTERPPQRALGQADYRNTPSTELAGR